VAIDGKEDGVVALGLPASGERLQHWVRSASMMA
jgi:hypothetical protein